jgi:hypothetical protein
MPEFFKCFRGSAHRIAPAGEAFKKGVSRFPRRRAYGSARTPLSGPNPIAFGVSLRAMSSLQTLSGAGPSRVNIINV